MRKYIPFNIEIALNESQINCGIYKIVFGELYYIGSSNNIKRRIKQHQREINFSLQVKIINPKGAYKKIKKYLDFHRRVKKYTAYVIDSCEEKYLRALEKQYINASIKDNNCVNELINWFNMTKEMKQFVNSRELQCY